MGGGSRATTTLAFDLTSKEGKSNLHSRLTRKRLPFRSRDIQVSRNTHGMCGFEATGALVLTDFHVPARARAEEDGVAKGSYESV